MHTIYVLEDDQSIRELIHCALEMAGMNVVCVDTVRAFRDAMHASVPDAVLIDIMLPDGNGLDVLSVLKKSHPTLPCILISALSKETDKVKGLNLGADDYIAKPFGVLELTARIQAALRRGNAKAPTSDGVVLDADAMKVYRNGQEIHLNPMEFKLLRYLAANPGRVLSREMILGAVWGFEKGETRTVDNHIARLRKKGFPDIETIFGVGYKYHS